MSTLMDAEREMAALLIQTLNLEGQSKDAVDPEGPLFGPSANGWGLDSIDALEIALAVQQKYGVRLRSDDDVTRQAFSSLRALTQHVLNQRGPTTS